MILDQFSFILVCLHICFCVVVESKTTFQAKSKFTNINNDCPKVALLLYDQASEEKLIRTNAANNFDRQVNQTLNLIKSILITKESNDCVLVILVANQKLRFERIKTEVYSWATMYTNNFHLEYVPLKYPKSRRWMQNIYRPGSTFGIFLPDILPYDSVIYMDTDMLFLRSVRDLWSEMNKFSPSTLASALIRIISLRLVEIPVIQRTGIGAGVMNMNLTRMRKRRWSQKVVTMTMPFLHKIKFGFEDFLNIYFHQFPEEVHLLSCDWNYWYLRCANPCRKDDDGIKGGISILHGNHYAFTNTGREPFYRSVYEAFDNTKLTSKFDLNDLLNRLKAGIDLTRTLHGNSSCAKDSSFEDLVLKRLRQKSNLNKRIYVAKN